MRKVKRWRFYCDFCQKSGCSGRHIAKHETGCTRNPNRTCGMCASAKIEQKPTNDLLEALVSGGVDAVLSLADGCPACVMAAIHAYRKDNPLETRFNAEDDGPSDYFEFDYRKAADAFWDSVNDGMRY